MPLTCLPPPAVLRAITDLPAQRAPAGQLDAAWRRPTSHRPVNSNRLALDWVRLGLARTPVDGRSYWTGVRLKG